MTRWETDNETQTALEFYIAALHFSGDTPHLHNFLLVIANNSHTPWKGRKGDGVWVLITAFTSWMSGWIGRGVNCLIYILRWTGS